jgi:hypothetical protein
MHSRFLSPLIRIVKSLGEGGEGEVIFASCHVTRSDKLYGSQRFIDIKCVKASFMTSVFTNNKLKKGPCTVKRCNMSDLNKRVYNPKVFFSLTLL